MKVNNIPPAPPRAKAPPSPNGSPAVSAEEARAALEREGKARSEACLAEIREVLVRHRCRLDVAVILREGSVSPSVNVVPVD